MIFALALLLAPAPEDAIDCWAADGAQLPGSTRSGLVGEARIAIVTAERASFTGDPVAAKPGARPYVVRGDEVVIGAAHGGFVPASYAGSGINGCLPVSALRILPTPPVPRLSDWSGSWSEVGKHSVLELAISLHDGELEITGQAQVQHGVPDNYNFGEFEGGGKPSGAFLITDPDGSCRTRFQLLGDYLVVSDVIIDHCPNYGMGVGFSGVYTRAPTETAAR